MGRWSFASRLIHPQASGRTPPRVDDDDVSAPSSRVVPPSPVATPGPPEGSEPATASGATGSTGEETLAPAAALLERAQQAVLDGDRLQARRLLLEALELDLFNREAWLWLAGVTDDPADATECLRAAVTAGRAAGSSLEAAGAQAPELGGQEPLAQPEP